MKRVLAYLKSFGFTSLSCLIVIWASQLESVHAFTVGPAAAIALAVWLSFAAWVLYYAIAIGICTPLGIKDPGGLLFTAFGTVAGALAIWLTGYVCPAGIVTVSAQTAVALALAVTLLNWSIALATRSVRKDLTFLPKRG